MGYSVDCNKVVMDAEDSAVGAEHFGGDSEVGRDAAVRAKILKSGDENLLRLLRTFPEETFGRLKAILKEQ